MDIDKYIENCDENLRLMSEIPDLLKNEPCILGIDEAGRGPVLGPMVYASCFAPLSHKQKLADLGCDDSKQLTEMQREDLFEILHEASKEFVGWMIDILSPTYLSTSMLSKTKYNLNSISHDTAINLIKDAIKLGINVVEVYIDTVGPPEKYQEKLQILFPDIKITVEKKADSLYPCVSAASICAKVCRDHIISQWEFKEKPEISREYGSGYTSDPKTKKWLRDNVDRIFGFPSFVRFSWSTASRVLDTEAVEVIWPDYDEDDADKSKVPITNFFASKSNVHKRHKFFTKNDMKRVKTF